MASMNVRAYERSHPWITFELDLRPAGHRLWVLLGQAVARCGQIAAAALPPGNAQTMQSLYLIKGAQATTAIEGNTLSEEQIRDRLEGRRRLPPSQEYLGQEVDNVVQACNDIEATIVSGGQIQLTPEWIADCNRRVLQGLDEHLEDGVVPGEIPTSVVGVGHYRGAPRADCAFLLDRLCEWLNGEQLPPVFGQPRENRVAVAIFKAIVAHLYIAWIHPFGDGNGRTARLVELMLLANAGVPLTSAHVLSNHYNRTRTDYYRQLDRASRANSGQGDPIEFVLYALQGFVDGLVEQCEYVNVIQLSIAWQHFVFGIFRAKRRSPALHRRLELVLALSNQQVPPPRADLRGLNPTVAALYAGKTDKTLTRDINWLLQEGLIELSGGTYRPRSERMLSFLPPVGDPS